MDSRGAGKPDSEIFRMRIIRRLRETFVVDENEVLIMVLERLGSILKRCRPKSFSAGPPPPLDLESSWISITGQKMLAGRLKGFVIFF